MKTNEKRLDVYFGKDGAEIVRALNELFDEVVPDEAAGQRGAKKGVFMRRLLDVDREHLRALMYPGENE